MNANTSLRIIEIADTAGQGIEITVDVRSGDGVLTGVIRYPFLSPDRMPDRDRQILIARQALLEFGPEWLTPESIDQAVSEYFVK